MTKKLRLLLIIAGVGLALLIGGAFAARSYLVPIYKEWRAERLNRIARQQLDSGDVENALATVRGNLAGNQKNLEAWRLAVEIAVLRESRDEAFYRSNIARLDPTLENQLELVRSALKHRVLRYATDGIEAIGDKARDNPEFHRLAAQTLLAGGKPVTARYHLLSAIELDPTDDASRLLMAEIELVTDDRRASRTLIADLERIAKDPALQLRALQLLVRDSLRSGEKVASAEYARQLLTIPSITIPYRVLALEALDKAEDPQADTLRLQLEAAVATSPADTAVLLGYLVRTERHTEAQRWYATLPEEIRKAPDVQRIVTGSFATVEDWRAVVALAQGSNWAEFEFLRHAYLSRAARANGRTSEATDSWKLALISAGDNPRSIGILLDLVSRWRWSGEVYDLLWKRFSLTPSDATLRQKLVEWERAQKNTVNLNRLFARFLEYDGNDAAAKNNFAYTSLLLDTNLSRAHSIARDLRNQYPTNAYFSTTFALSQLKQGKPEEALRTLQEIGEANLIEPERQLYYAVVLAATGQIEQAESILDPLLPDRFLNEEAAFLRKARDDIHRNRLARRIDTTASGTSIAAASPVLGPLPPAVREVSSTAMRVADDLAGRKEWDELLNQTRRANWAEFEHLRYATLAYAQRGLAREGDARASWKSAITTAGRDPTRIRQLESLAISWQWALERIEAIDRVFELDPRDKGVLTELLAYYRSQNRTQELIRVLGRYLTLHTGPSIESSTHAYYCLVSGVNLSTAHVAARAGYDASPTDPLRRLVYAFSLIKQARNDEAWQLLQDPAAATDPLVPAPLLRASVLGAQGQKPEALLALEQFDPAGRLPEEIALAGNLRRELTAVTPPAGS